MSKNTNEETKKRSNALLNYFGLEHADIYIKAIKKYSQEHFEKFSAIIVAITTIGVWVVRAIGYTYQAARLSVYDIDKLYVSLNDNILLQVIEFFAAGILYGTLNYIYFKIATPKETGKKNWKRILKISALFIIEMLAVLFLSIIQTYYGISGFFQEVRGYSVWTGLTLIIILFVSVFSINFLGILISNPKYSEKEISSDDSSEEKNEVLTFEKLFPILNILIITIAVILIATHIGTKLGEQHRTNFKVISEQVEVDIENNTIFTLEDRHSYTLYVVVFENEEYYILCQLYKTNEGIRINKKCQKIVSKENIITYNISNIYEIPYIQ